jgi:xanthine/uracil permease
MFVILLIGSCAKGFLKSIATFIGVIIGWIFAALLSVAKSPTNQGNRIFSIPELFAWGQPTFDPGISITCTIAALLLLSMVFASVKGTADAVDEEASPDRMNKTVGVHGATTISIGMGVMFLPASAFSKLPQVLSYLLSNGLVDGMLIAIILETVVLRERAV